MKNKINLNNFVHGIAPSEHLSPRDHEFLNYLLKYKGNEKYCSSAGIAEHILKRNMQHWSEDKHSDVRVFVTRVRNGLRAYFEDPKHGRKSEYRLDIGSGAPYRLQVVLNERPSSLAQFWESHLDSALVTRLVSTEPVFFYDSQKRSFVRYLEINADTPKGGKGRLGPRLKGLIPCFTYVPSGEAKAEQLLTNWFKSQKKDLIVEVSRNCNDAEPYTGNLILLGNKRTNRFIRNFQNEQHFELYQDDYRIVNRVPQGYKLKSYADLDKVTGMSFTHVLVTRCRGTFNNVCATIIAANHGRAAAKIAELLTSDTSVSNLFKTIGVERQKAMPDSFQILFKVQTKDFDLAGGEPEVVLCRGI
jgi:hypothetical protein